MVKIKKLIVKHFSSFAYFYSYLKYRIFISLFLSICVGILDGLGLTMFMPLLQMVSNAEAIDTKTLGNLSFIIEGLKHAGISLTLLNILAVMTCFFILKGLAVFLNISYRVTLQQRFIRNMRLRILNALNKIGYKDFVVSDVGRIQNTMTGEIDKVSQAYSFYFQAAEKFILVLVYISFAFFVDFRFALLVSIGGILSNLLYRIVYKKTKGASHQLTKDSHIYQGQVIQHVANYKYLKSTGLIETFAQRLSKTILFIEATRKKIGIYSAILQATREPILIAVISVVILVQTTVLGGNIGAIILSLVFFYRALNMLVNMQNSWNKFLENIGSMENVVSFQKELEKQHFFDGQTQLDYFHDKIVLQNLSFNYGNLKILKDVNLIINKNQSIAFVGESGSGKTTLVNVIAGLLPAESGSISIDGISYSNLQLDTLQKRIGYITQEPVVFNDTIFNNVTFWAERTPKTLERFYTALRKASLFEFISALELKDETLLGNNGINLSGGQKQRISIARELYKNVDILIMDEATSALDSQTEQDIQSNIDALKGQYTLLIVAHRLSTIKNVDKIVLMSQGYIEREGTFKDLSNNAESFKNMIGLQEI